MFTPGKLLKKFWRRVRRAGRNSGNKGIQPAQSTRCSPVPTRAVGSLELELTEERGNRARLEQDCQKAKAEADELVEAKAKSEDALKKEVGDKDAIIQRLEREANEMQKKVTEARTAVERVQELTTRLSEKDKLLSERTTELTAAQAFLTRVDAVSEAEVVAMVESLNTLISSASGAISNTWDQRTPVPGTLVEESVPDKIRGYFGDMMFEQIAARDSVAVALAVEAYLAQFVERVTSGWGGGDAAETLGKIYEGIFTEEGQTIASRWRTLTKRYIPRQEPPRDAEIIGDLARILMITRSFSDSSEAVEAVRSGAGAEIKAIIEATLQLDDIIKTKVASSDMSVYIVSPGTAFIETNMTNEFEKYGAREGGEPKIVAGTMEIGLLQRMGEAEKVLRKPRVILERDLTEPEDEGKR